MSIYIQILNNKSIVLQEVMSFWREISSTSVSVLMSVSLMLLCFSLVINQRQKTHFPEERQLLTSRSDASAEAS